MIETVVRAILIINFSYFLATFHERIFVHDVQVKLGSSFIHFWPRTAIFTHSLMVNETNPNSNM